MNSPNTRPTLWKFQSHRLAWHRPQDVTPQPGPPPQALGWTGPVAGLGWAEQLPVNPVFCWWFHLCPSELPCPARTPFHTARARRMRVIHEEELLSSTSWYPEVARPPKPLRANIAATHRPYPAQEYVWFGP